MVLSVFLALGLYHLDYRSMWVDEGLTLNNIAGLSRHDLFRPLYFLFVRLWTVGGKSIFYLRLSSVLFGLGSLTFLFLIGLRLKNLELALISSLLYALSSYHLERAQEIRMYTMFSFLALAEMYLFMLLRERFSWKKFVVYWVISFLCLATDPLGAFLNLFQNFSLIINHRKQRQFLKNTILVEAGLIILSIPWILKIWGFSVYFQGKWIKHIKIPSLLDPTGLPGSIGRSMILVTEYGKEIDKLSFLIGMLILVSLLYNAFIWLRRKEEARGFIALWYLIPVLAMLTAGIFNFKLIFCRYLFFLAPAAYLNLSFFLSAFRPSFKYLGYALLIVVSIFLLSQYYRYPGEQDWKGAALFLAKEKKTERRILIYPKYATSIVRYYYPEASLEGVRANEDFTNDGALGNFLAPYLENKQETWIVFLTTSEGAQEIIHYLKGRHLAANEQTFQKVVLIKLKMNSL